MKLLQELYCVLRKHKLRAASPLSERYELDLTAFAAWRVDMSYTWGVGLG